MQKTVHFKAKKVNGEMLFDIEGRLFDSLEAFDLFEGGQLSICRDDELIDETSGIWEVGTHGSCTAFLGLESGDKYFGIPDLLPEKYQEGDSFTLTFECEKEFDFSEYLRSRFIQAVVFRRALNIMPKGKIGDLRTVCSQIWEELRGDEAVIKPEVLRFKSI